jgi:hypothetical protein
VLGAKYPVQGVQREIPAAMQEIREMRLGQSGLTGQQRDTHRPPLYPSQQFQAEPFVHLSEIHLWKIRRRR